MAFGEFQFNDSPEGDGDGATKQSTPKMPRHRCLFIKAAWKVLATDAKRGRLIASTGLSLN